MTRKIGAVGVLASVTGLVVLGALRPPLPSRPTTSPQGSVTAKSANSLPENVPAAVESYGANPGLRALQEMETFFATAPGLPPTDSGPQPSDKSPSSSKKPRQPSGLSSSVENAAARVVKMARAAGYQLMCAIALVPDPLDSQIGASFDQSISAIVRGAASVGWLRDRHWLPWQADSRSTAKHGSSGRDAAASVGLETGRSHLHDPGVLLFKSDRRLLALFLVGESHISGVEPDAFKVALNVIAALGGTDSTGNPVEIKLGILGPTFSGSVGSVRRALVSLCKELPFGPRGKLRFISGSVTNAGAREEMLAPLETECRLKPAELTATVVPDSLALYHAQRYFLSHLGWKWSEIALLTEADSVYGSSTRMNWSLMLPVPSGTADVRSALERRRRKGETVDSAKSLKIAPLALELPLDESGTPSDSVPSFAVMSAPLTELNANRLLGVLTRERIRHVGLFLTDVRDKLFFAQQLRAHAPSLSIFTFESSLLYTHPREFPFLHGMLIVSSYPLAGETQYFLAPRADDWPSQDTSFRARGESPVRMQFSSDLEEGLYNAAVIMLGPLCDTEPELCPVIDYLSVPGRAVASPAVWITAVGQDRLVPLTAITALGPASALKQIAEIRKSHITAPVTPELESFISRVRVLAPFRYSFYLGTCLVLLLYVNMLAGYGARAEKWRRKLRTNPVLRPLVRSSPRSRRQWFVFMTLFVVLTTVLWMLLSAIYLFPVAVRREFSVPHAAAVSTWSRLETFEEGILDWVVRLLPLIDGVLLFMMAFVVWQVGAGLKPGQAPTSGKAAGSPDPGTAGADAATPLKRTARLRFWMTVAAAVVVFLAIAGASTLIRIGPADSSTRTEILFRFLRVSGGPGGLSPLLGPLLICIGILASLAFELQRLHIRDDWRPSQPLLGSIGQGGPAARDFFSTQPGVRHLGTANRAPHSLDVGSSRNSGSSISPHHPLLAAADLRNPGVGSGFRTHLLCTRGDHRDGVHSISLALVRAPGNSSKAQLERVGVAVRRLSR